MDFKINFGEEGPLGWDWVVRVGRVRGREGRVGEGTKGEGGGGGVRGGKGRGEGLLNFHLIYQKTWAEPGNPSLY